MTDFESLIHPATKKQLKAIVGISGFAGSGKTWSALLMASGLGEKIVIIDTERRSAEIYAHQFDFQYFHLPLDPPYSPERYIQAIKACEKHGFDVIIIDSLSHAWTGSGGVLDIHHDATVRSQSKNSYIAWGFATPQQNKLMDVIFDRTAKRHMICTLRTQADYETEKDDSGKSKVVHIGTKIVQREGVPYEFDVVFELNEDHTARVVFKDRTKLFEGKPPFLITKADGENLKAFLDEGEPVGEPTVKTKEMFIAEMAACQTLQELATWNEENTSAIDDLAQPGKKEVQEFRAKRKQVLLGGGNNV